MFFAREETQTDTLERPEHDPLVVAAHERLMVAVRQAQEAQDRFDAVKTTSGPTNYKYEKARAELGDAENARKAAQREYDATLEGARDRIAAARKPGHRELVKQFEEVLGQLEAVLTAIARYDQETYDLCHRRHGIPAQWMLGNNGAGEDSDSVKESLFSFQRRWMREQHLLD